MEGPSNFVTKYRLDDTSVQEGDSNTIDRE